VAINAIYGTNVLAIVSMGEHVAKVIGSVNMKNPTPELVDKIAALPSRKGNTKMKRTSFAAKFCHFFVDKDRFPIYDDAARQAIKLHLGRKNYVEDKQHPYTAFYRNLERLWDEAKLTCSMRD